MTNTGPDIKKLITVPAMITLGVTLLRLAGEFMNLPGWLASKAPGGNGAVIGITWLAPIFGVYFAIKLMEYSGPLWKNLLKTLFAYGLAARIPVVLIMGLAIFGNWGTHYDAFPPEMQAWTPMTKFLVGGVVTQFLVWVCIWTVGSGMITGMIASKVMGEKQKTAEA